MKRINRIVALLITLMLTSFALGETFEVRDGIHYGMTEDEVREFEKSNNGPTRFTSCDGYIWANTSIAGIDNCTLFYYFDDTGNLNGIVYRFNDQNGSLDKSYTENIYREMKSTLENKYGNAIHEDDNYTFGITSPALDTSGVTNYTEWLVEYDDCYVVIDLVMSYGSFTRTYHCMTGYRMISYDELDEFIRNAQESAEKSNAAKNKDL